MKVVVCILCIQLSINCITEDLSLTRVLEFPLSQDSFNKSQTVLNKSIYSEFLDSILEPVDIEKKPLTVNF